MLIFPLEIQPVHRLRPWRGNGSGGSSEAALHFLAFADPTFKFWQVLCYQTPLPKNGGTQASAQKLSWMVRRCCMHGCVWHCPPRHVARRLEAVAPRGVHLDCPANPSSPSLFPSLSSARKGTFAEEGMTQLSRGCNAPFAHPPFITHHFHPTSTSSPPSPLRFLLAKILLGGVVGACYCGGGGGGSQLWGAHRCNRFSPCIHPYQQHLVLYVFFCHWWWECGACRGRTRGQEVDFCWDSESLVLTPWP